MKTTSLLCCLFALAPGAIGAATPAGNQSFNPPDIIVNTEVTELASGYEKAFQSLTRQPVAILLRQGDKKVLLRDVSSVKKFGGSLLIEIRPGLTYIINPKDVIVITDDSRLEP